MYKKIYLEITNNCNLDCSFCIKNNRIKKYLSKEEYLLILNKIKSYTKYLYLHVSGEPLLHPLINEFIDLASKDFYINITTNGYLINRIKNNQNIRQINISLHSFDPKYNISMTKYLDNIIEVINNLANNTYISLRFWVNNIYNKEIIDYLSNKLSITIKLENNFKIRKNVFVSIEEEFMWPTLDNDYYNSKGTCYALKDHIGILTNGDIVPCCLDVNGVIKLGNIFIDDLDKIKSSKKYNNMLNGFKCHQKVEELCKKCNFYDIKIAK